jgi:hypothetical protein
VTTKKTATDRSARLAQVQREQKSAERRRMLAIYGTTAVVALVIIGLTAWGLIRSAGGVDGIQEYEDLSFDHVPGLVEYELSPPAGGDHNETWQNCGFYTEPVANEHAVHSLEHGAVWITYQPDLSEEDIETLREDMGSSGYVLVSPYEGQESPVVLTAWGVQLEVDSADDPKVEQFLNKYVQGPQTREAGAACSGGTSDTGVRAQALLQAEAGGTGQQPAE